MLDRIRIVLVNTSHPGNIGSTARAMKTMGLHQLYLVEPLQFPHAKAIEMSAGATDILEQAKVVATLHDAISDCTQVYGTSTRQRTIPWPLHSPRGMAETIVQTAEASEIAIVFGREQSGLTNEELECCHAHVQIPANPDYSSLNLAAAVQIICYELRVQQFANQELTAEWDYRPANMDEMEKFFEALRLMLIQIDFLKLNAPRKLMTRLRRLFFRARPDIMEMNILRGMLATIEKYLPNK